MWNVLLRGSESWTTKKKKIINFLVPPLPIERNDEDNLGKKADALRHVVQSWRR